MSSFGLEDDLLALHAGNPHHLTLSDAVVSPSRRRDWRQGRKPLQRAEDWSTISSF